MSANAKSATARAESLHVDAKTLLEPVREELVRVDELFRRALGSESVNVRSLVEHASQFRGKQLRPALVLLAGKTVGRTAEDHVTLGAVIEMIHTATLLHDDVLDHATTRRNVASVNSLYGNEIPILLGDFIYAEAFSLANQMADRTASIHLAKTTRRLCTGEIDQNCNRGRFDLTLSEYLRIIEDKTAALYAAAARLGAWYAGGVPAQVEALEEYGRLLGIAFQIIDDCLDLAGDERSVGKSLGTDLSERKMTLPLIRLFARVGPEIGAKIRRLLLDRGIDDPRAALRSLVDFAPDIESARDTAEQFVRDGLARLAPLPPTPAKATLQTLGEFVLERDR